MEETTLTPEVIKEIRDNPKSLITDTLKFPDQFKAQCIIIAYAEKYPELIDRDYLEKRVNEYYSMETEEFIVIAEMALQRIIHFDFNQN